MQASPLDDYEKRLIEESRNKKILEIGSGRFPFIIRLKDKNIEVDYCGIDISRSEIMRSPVKYHHFVQDFSGENVVLGQTFDVIFSRFVCEHVKNAESFYKNIYNHLSEGGISVHLFPNLLSFPFLINYMIPENISNFVLNLFFPSRELNDNKFPAYYKMCHILGSENELKRIGFRYVSFTPYYGHHYFNNIAVVRNIAHAYFRLKEFIGLKILAEYYILELEK